MHPSRLATVLSAPLLIVSCTCGVGELFGQGKDGGAGACPEGCAEGERCSQAGLCIPEGSCAAAADCPEGMTCDFALESCVPGGACGSVDLGGERVAANLLVSLDRSCSMDKTFTGSGGQTKWAIAVAALNQVTATYEGKIRFGLALFPDLAQPACDQAAVTIPVAAGAGPELRSLLTASLDAGDPYFPDGPCVTNIDTAMDQAAREPSLRSGDRPRYVLLLSDGRQSAGCNLAGADPGTTSIIHAMRVDAGIRTFVLGFGGGVDPAQLNIFADAGGVPSSGPNAFYAAEDQASLEAALATIARRTLGCSYDLAQVPPDPSKLFVFFDDVRLIPRDPTRAEGWDYDPSSNRVTFHGQACADLEDGKVSDLDIVFGCATPSLN